MSDIQLLMPQTPEQKARQKIDRMLTQCGWLVQDHAEMNISAGPGAAIREFPLSIDSADYLLYAGGKAIGVATHKRVHPHSDKEIARQAATVPRQSLPQSDPGAPGVLK